MANTNNSGYNGSETQNVIEEVVKPHIGPRMLADIPREDRILYEKHPECKVFVEDAVRALAEVVGNPPTDQNHRSYPYLTDYERTSVLAFRASQLQKGTDPFVEVPIGITDVYDIAKMELEQRKLPFAIKRTMPDGRPEIWKLKDLKLQP